MGCVLNCFERSIFSIRWSHDGRDSVSNHQPHHCLLNRIFTRRSKKTSKLRVTGFVWGIHRGPVNSPHKWPVTRKMFPFDDVIMFCCKTLRDMIWLTRHRVTVVSVWCLLCVLYAFIRHIFLKTETTISIFVYKKCVSGSGHWGVPV